MKHLRKAPAQPLSIMVAILCFEGFLAASGTENIVQEGRTKDLTK